MEERAQIIRLLPKNMAEVELRGHSACTACGKCAFGQKKQIRYEVKNPINAQVGDLVTLEMETKSLLSAVLIIYLLPLINLLIGYGLGSWINSRFKIWPGEGLAILSGFLFMGLTFGLIRILDQRLAKKSNFRPRIKTIVDLSKRPTS